jgi:exodeoxyribonuclease VIII
MFQDNQKSETIQVETCFKKEPFEKYKESPGLNAHGIIALNKSPLHYHSEYILKKNKKVTPALDFGHKMHAALLEPSMFKERVIVSPKFDKRTKKGKEELTEFESTLKPDSIVVTQEQADQLTGMLKSILNHKIASGLLKNGIAEHSGYFYREGILCKIRPDYLRSDGVVIDLKTTMDASMKTFQRSIVNYNWHIQAAWYNYGSKIITGRQKDIFIYLAVEKTEPFACAVYVADPTILEKGEIECDKAFYKYKECLKTNRWPGYQVEAENISLPYWAMWEDQDD